MRGVFGLEKLVCTTETRALEEILDFIATAGRN